MLNSIRVNHQSNFYYLEIIDCFIFLFLPCMLFPSKGLGVWRINYYLLRISFPCNCMYNCPIVIKVPFGSIS